ncbi:MAG: AI-2E family transporter [Oscillospiraceae bacterium]|nr:AI-2E family transporter [Oscillospiraceae bacterium]
MKFEFNRKYLSIALYTLCTVAAAAAIILAMIHPDKVSALARNFFDLLSPFIWGFALAYLLNPILNFTEDSIGQLTKNKLSKKIVRVIGMLLTYAFAVLILWLFFKIVIPQLIDSVTSLAALITTWFNGITPWINQLITDYDLQNLDLAGFGTDTISKITSAVTDMLKSFSNAIPQVVQTAASLASGIFDIIMGIIISIYLLFSKEKFFAHGKKFLYAFFPKGFTEKTIEIAHESNRIFSGFISGKILDSAIIGVLCFICMSIFRWPYTMLISVIVGVTNVIPYFGPFIGAIPSALILLIVDPKIAVLFGIFILALQQLDGNVIGPKILGDSTGLSSFWVIFSITVFSSLLGPIGMFIGVPLFAVIYSLVRKLAAWRLESKGMPVDTKEYSSPDHPIL